MRVPVDASVVDFASAGAGHPSCFDSGKAVAWDRRPPGAARLPTGGQ